MSQDKGDIFIVILIFNHGSIAHGVNQRVVPLLAWASDVRVIGNDNYTCIQARKNEGTESYS